MSYRYSEALTQLISTLKKDTDIRTIENHPYDLIIKVENRFDAVAVIPLPVKGKMYEQPLKSSTSAIEERMFRIYNILAVALEVVQVNLLFAQCQVVYMHVSYCMSTVIKEFWFVRLCYLDEIV